MARFPDGLVFWAGHRRGGVRRLFDKASGRPSETLIRTRLLGMLDAWALDMASGKPGSPRIILLAGGPGNGKTEAIEECVYQLDKACAMDGALVTGVAKQYAAGTNKPMPRIVEAVLRVPTGIAPRKIAIVPDASAAGAMNSGLTPAQLFLAEVEQYAFQASGDLYIACVNRGVIDDALASAIDQGRDAARKLLERVIQAVGMAADAPPAWPLLGYDEIAVWPMDMESLFLPVDDAVSPAEHLIDIAIDPADWPAEGSCAAGDRCPFCLSRAGLAARKIALLELLRWYELGSGKRWNFRDLGSLVSYMLANVPGAQHGDAIAPCEWAARMANIDAGKTSASKREREEAPYLLVSALYQHCLFGAWPRLAAKALRSDIRALGLEANSTLMGLCHFINGQRARSVAATLGPQLKALTDLLDPALADADEVVQLTSKTAMALRDIDARFSQSVDDGLSFIKRYHVLGPLEVDLLARLAAADTTLSDPMHSNKKPLAAARLQVQLRDFACRLVRRSVGVRIGIGRDSATLSLFEKLVDGDPALLHGVAKDVEGLLNEGDRFMISLNTTFGEPQPPPMRRATLTTEKQKARPAATTMTGRPKAPLRFLKVGNGAGAQLVPLTFELFRSVQELREGMLAAVLPRTVRALIDTTRARLSGEIVRNPELLEGAEIRIGRAVEVIAWEMNQFVSRHGALP